VFATPVRVLALIVAIVVAGQWASPSAMAASLDEYRAQGVIAERFDGFVEVRGSGPADATALVNEVNAKRRALYGERAAAQGVSAEEVGKIYAAQILESAPVGTYFRKSDGSYVRK